MDDDRVGAPSRARPRSRKRTALAVVVAAALALGVFGVIRSRRSSSEPSVTRAELRKTVATAVEDAKSELQGAPARSALVYQAVLPSLVFIRVSGGEQTETTDGGEPAPGGDTTAPGADDDPSVPDELKRGLGSGVVVNEEGAILTAHHVVAGAEKIEVTFADGTSSPATIVSAEPENDIAVLMAERGPEAIVPAVLGGGVNVGDEAYAVGHPLGLVASMSAGVVSGLDRSIPVEDGGTLDGLIQFDASVNPGSSGGPLLDRNGQVVGIVTALANPAKQGFFVGIGFAVPIATAGGAAGGPPV